MALGVDEAIFTALAVFIAEFARGRARIAVGDTASLRIAYFAAVAKDAVVGAKLRLGSMDTVAVQTSIDRAGHRVVAVCVQYASGAAVGRFVADLSCAQAGVAAGNATGQPMAKFGAVAEQSVVGAERVVGGELAGAIGRIAAVDGTVDQVITKHGHGHTGAGRAGRVAQIAVAAVAAGAVGKQGIGTAAVGWIAEVGAADEPVVAINRAAHTSAGQASRVTGIAVATGAGACIGQRDVDASTAGTGVGATILTVVAIGIGRTVDHGYGACGGGDFGLAQNGLGDRITEDGLPAYLNTVVAEFSGGIVDGGDGEAVAEKIACRQFAESGGPGDLAAVVGDETAVGDKNLVRTAGRGQHAG